VIVASGILAQVLLSCVVLVCVLTQFHIHKLFNFLCVCINNVGTSEHGIGARIPTLQVSNDTDGSTVD